MKTFPPRKLNQFPKYLPVSALELRKTVWKSEMEFPKTRELFMRMCNNIENEKLS